MAFLEVQRALDTRLSTLPTLPAVAWPNTKYKPVEDTVFIKPTVLPTASILKDLAGQQQDAGMYQVSIFVPLGRGVKDLLELADEVRAHFAADKDLLQGGVNVWIQNISIGAVTREDAWLTTFVEINYFSIN